MNLHMCNVVSAGCQEYASTGQTLQALHWFSRKAACNGEPGNANRSGGDQTEELYALAAASGVVLALASAPRIRKDCAPA